MAFKKLIVRILLVFIVIGLFGGTQVSWAQGDQETNDRIVTINADSDVQNGEQNTPISVTQAVYGEENLALRKTVYASSSYENANTGTKFLVDGIRSSTSASFGWSSDVYNTSNTDWVWATVDLGASYEVRRIDLYPRDDGQYAGNNFPINFDLKVSPDNVNWVTVKQLRDYPLNPRGVQSFTFDPVRARFVRVEGLGTKTWMYGMQLAEMEVYGDPATGLGATDGVHADGELKVQVRNSTGQPLHAQFYKRVLTPADLQANGFSGFANANSMDVPAYYPQEYGDIGFDSAALAKVSRSDNVYYETKSLQNAPYHRFDLEFSEPVTNDVFVTWEGRTNQMATLYAWDFIATKWQPIASREGSDYRDIVLTGKIGSYNVQANRAHFMVAASQKNITESAKLPGDGEYDFTFVWMTDTQFYSKNYPQIFQRMNEWIVDNRDDLNIQYVIHTGDLVENWNDENQWQVADTNMAILDQAAVPYGVVSGNHDVNHNVNDYSYYWKYFGKDRFAGKPWYGGEWQNNRHHYDLVTEGDMKFIILYLGVYGRIDQGTIDWANHILKKHKDRYAIVGTHAYIDPSGKYGVNGKEIMEKIVAPNDNVFMTVNGHYHGAFYNVKRMNGRVVYEVLSDYQSGPEGGSGYLRLLQFDAESKRMYMNTYSPYKDDYNFFTDAAEQATFPLDVKKGEIKLSTDRFGVSTKWENVLIGEAGNVSTGPLSIQVDENTIGENDNGWFVKLTDSTGNEIISDIWDFQKPAVLESAVLTGNRLILGFNTQLQSDSVPDPADFIVQENGKRVQASSIIVFGDQVEITLNGSPNNIKKLMVSYTPGTVPLLDISGRQVEGFENMPVRE